MSHPPLSSETLHASCVSKDGRAILISGRSGAGKSDLALRLIDRGATLVSDDYTVVRRVNGSVEARPPETIQGKMEIRGLGVIDLAWEENVPVGLLVDLDGPVERLPLEKGVVRIAGVDVPSFALNALEPSAPIKVEAALRLIGLQLP